MALTEEQKQQLTPNGRLNVEIMEARQRGDNETADRLMQNLIIPAEALMAAKRAMGAEWIEERKLKTETAEAKYGKNWLNQ